MKEIEGVKLSDLVEQAMSDLLSERKASASRIIKQLFQRHEALSKEISKLNNSLKRSTEKKLKIEEKLEQIKQGNWNLLNEDKQETKED